MKAKVIRGFGETSVLETANVEMPEVRPGHVLIRVAASSVNPVDVKIRSGAIQAVVPDFPAILHGDMAGVVEAVGEGVTDFKPGDEVYGCPGGFKGTQGALAEYMLADAELIAPKPRSLSMQEAAVLPLVSITAWEGLFCRAQLKEGQTVLIHAGAGGVGHVAVQLAKAAGAAVYTTVSSTEKSTLAQSLGADGVIYYREQTVAEYVRQYTNGKGFDVVFDTVGEDNIDRSFEAAKMNGSVVTIAARSAHDLSPMHAKGLSLHAVFMLLPIVTGINRKRHGEILREVSKLADEGKLRPQLDPNSYSFEDAALAHRHWESGNTVGKLSLYNSWNN